MRKRMSLLEDYRARAEAAALAAKAAGSRGVRERLLHAEATWRAAAERVERTLARREALFGDRA